MIYAPVIIPTLNRAEHLKRCLESLLANSWAKHTDVYVSVDFPPAERYVAGYEKVKDYLNTADFSGFQNMHIIFQEKNLGPSENYRFLRNWIRDRYDRFIFSEDDNEFAPNFLEYQDKGLMLFDQDKRVMAICGAKDTDWETGGQSVTFAKLCPAYGFGTWFETDDALRSSGGEVLLSPRAMSLSSVKDLAGKNRFLAIAYITEVLLSDNPVYWDKDGSLSWCDSLRSIYLHWTDGVCVVPAQPKARTWGNDGSGVNMKKLEDEVVIPLDKEECFSYPQPEQLSFYPENYQKGDQYLSMWSYRSAIKAIIYYFILRLCGKNFQKARRIVNGIRRSIKK